MCIYIYIPYICICFSIFMQIYVYIYIYTRKYALYYITLSFDFVICLHSPSICEARWTCFVWGSVKRLVIWTSRPRPITAGSLDTWVFGIIERIGFATYVIISECRRYTWVWHKEMHTCLCNVQHTIHIGFNYLSRYIHACIKRKIWLYKYNCIDMYKCICIYTDTHTHSQKMTHHGPHIQLMGLFTCHIVCSSCRWVRWTP